MSQQPNDAQDPQAGSGPSPAAGATGPHPEGAAPELPPLALQLDRVEPVAGSEGGAPSGPADSSGMTCGFCKAPLVDTYYAVNDQVRCGRCTAILRAQVEAKVRPRDVLRAALRALGPVALGAILYYAVRAITGYEIGLIAILVGYLVGSSVKKSSHGRGGWQYQAVAVLLTYVSVSINYAPEVMKAAFQGADKADKADKAQGSPAAGQPAPPPATGSSDATRGAAPAAPADPVVGAAPAPPSPSGDNAATLAPAADAEPVAKKISFGYAVLGVVLFLGFVIGLSLAVPVMAGLEAPMGLLIVGFALYEAWRLNKRPEVRIVGPLRVGGAAPPPVAP